MLPRAEIDNLLTAVFEAVDLAAEGRVADGFEVLLLGNAKALEGEQNFEPTAEAVEEAWDGASRRYARRWGVGRA
jgi:hypothetical protein